MKTPSFSLTNKQLKQVIYNTLTNISIIYLVYILSILYNYIVTILFYYNTIIL